jgi:hypothetical protein
VQGDAIRNIVTSGNIEVQNSGVGAAIPSPFQQDSAINLTFLTNSSQNRVRRMGLNLSLSTPTANENRPVNMAVRYLIRAVM